MKLTPEKKLGFERIPTNDLCNTVAVLSSQLEADHVVKNSQRDPLPVVGLIAQLIQNCTGIEETCRGHGFEPDSKPEFFRALISQLLKLCT